MQRRFILAELPSYESDLVIFSKRSLQSICNAQNCAQLSLMQHQFQQISYNVEIMLLICKCIYWWHRKMIFTTCPFNLKKIIKKIKLKKKKKSLWLICPTFIQPICMSFFCAAAFDKWQDVLSYINHNLKWKTKNQLCYPLEHYWHFNMAHDWLLSWHIYLLNQLLTMLHLIFTQLEGFLTPLLICSMGVQIFIKTINR